MDVVIAVEINTKILLKNVASEPVLHKSNFPAF
jgi:hypothetical protein